MKRLDEIEARWAKATTGPWALAEYTRPETPEAKAEAIAAAPEDIAYLIAEVRRYEAIARAAEESLRAQDHYANLRVDEDPVAVAREVWDAREALRVALRGSR